MKARLRILRVYPFLPPLSGGMEKHILRLTEEQRRLNCEVVLAYNQGQVTDPSDIRLLSFFNLRKIKPQSLRDLVFYIALILKIVRRRDRFDIVHVHGDWSAFLFARCLRYITKSQKISEVFMELLNAEFGVVYIDLF